MSCPHARALEAALLSLAQKVERSTRALVEENVNTEGGLVSAAKSYAKAVIEIARAIFSSGATVSMQARDRAIQLLEKALSNTEKAMDRVSEASKKRLHHLERHIKWAINTLQNTPVTS